MKRILVVHRERDMRELLKLHLAVANYSVTLAADAVEGARAVLRQAFDLIVLDANVPYLDGFEFVAALRSDGVAALIPIIFLASRPETVERALRLGASACLTTPLYGDVLLKAVRDCLEPEQPALARAGLRAAPPMSRSHPGP